jgi:hypothetical protein
MMLRRGVWQACPMLGFCSAQTAIPLRCGNCVDTFCLDAIRLALFIPCSRNLPTEIKEGFRGIWRKTGGLQCF